MKIGILTFHSQLNYGGVLQCWALQKALARMGHEVVVVDRWLDEKNARLRNEFARLGWKGWVKLIIRGLLGCGDFGKLLRTVRTIRFVRGLRLTKEHFYDWSEIKQSNNQTIKQLDLLVVGSDQVWHCGDWGDPRPYLLEGAPEIKAISYAASFGLTKLPDDQVDLYKRGLGRFAAISCREQEGVNICHELGFSATHVVDPTLLIDPSEWHCLVKSGSPAIRKSNDVLVCYFISADLLAAFPAIEKFAEKMKCTVKVFADDAHLRQVPQSVAAAWKNFQHGRVKFCRGYGPKEFVKAFADATWALTDSFHAVMFSSIFKCDARFLVPHEGWRKPMLARIEEFAASCIKGTFFVDDVEHGLSSFAYGERILYNLEKIAAMRAESLKWLEDACLFDSCPQ